MPEGTGNSRSEHGSVGKGNGTDAKGNKSDGSKGKNVNDTKNYGGALGGYKGGASVGGMKTLGSLPGSGGKTTVGGIPATNDTLGIAQKTLVDRKIASPADAAKAVQAQRDFMKARQQGPSLVDRLIAAIPGVDIQKVSLHNPASYANGTVHHELGLFGGLGGLGGMASGQFGAGFLGEFAGGLLDDALGTHWGTGPAGIDPQTGKAVGYSADSGFGGFDFGDGKPSNASHDSRDGGGLNKPGEKPSTGVPSGPAPTNPTQTAPQPQPSTSTPRAPTPVDYTAYNPVNIPTYGSWVPVYDQNGQIVGWRNPLQQGIGALA